MIINNWYAAAASGAVAEEPLQVRMLGCAFVLFRDADGKAACLSDVCCHRGGSLSHGRRSNGCVQCPYHGWEYGRDGKVRLMPTLGSDAKIPARARVDSYPVQERWGIIWTFLGDMPENERPQLPDLLPEYGDHDTWRMMYVERDWNVNWARLKENLADASHLFLVHSFGQHLPAKIDIFEIEETDWGLRVPQTYTAKPTSESRTSVNAPQAEKTRTQSEILIELSIIGLMQKNSQKMVSGYDQVIWNALTPIDATHTRHFNLHFRNFLTEADSDVNMQKTIEWGFDEDAAVIDHVEPMLTPVDQNCELLVATDGPEKAYRDKVARIGKRLGVIDWRRMQDQKLDRVQVIPSPARAGGGSWVHATVPLIESED
jgi:phenylpropionate dioxygenase-like ring-hydroxylating dioxygenase large terminal subunit